jgi:lipoprotein-releasing system ATP-binding protein
VPRRAPEAEPVKSELSQREAAAGGDPGSGEKDAALQQADPSTNGDLLRAEDLHKYYRIGSNELRVLIGINLEVKRGSIVAVLGASGVGKSTLLHILGGLDRPTKGTVMVGATDMFAYGEAGLARFRNESMGFVFQFHHLLPEFTAVENVMMPALVAKRDRKEAFDRACALLEEVGLYGRGEHKPSELSGGEAQRVAVARALMNDPWLVLADEPSGNLDASSGGELQKLFRDLNSRKGQTFVIVTHDPDLAGMAHKVFTLRGGLLIEGASS